MDAKPNNHLDSDSARPRSIQAEAEINFEFLDTGADNSSEETTTNIVEDDPIQTPWHVTAFSVNVPKKCNDDESYQCTLCNFMTPLKQTFDTHMKAHTACKIIKCGQCDYVALNADSLKLHLNVHTQDRYKCIKCSFTTSQNFELVNHYMINHPEDNLKQKENSANTCDIEKPIFHNTRDFCYTCSKCDFRASKVFVLLNHFRMNHIVINSANALNQVNVNLYKCKKCMFIAATEHILKEHMKKVHTVMVFKCTHCYYTSPNRDDMMKHLHFHRNNFPYKCTKCDFKALHNFTLMNHLRMAHVPTQKFKCKKCDYGTPDYGDLFMHVDTHDEDISMTCDKFKILIKEEPYEACNEFKMLIKEEPYEA